MIEDVNSKVLQALIQNTDNLAVLFYDANNQKSLQVLNELESIDDECDTHNILLVKIGKLYSFFFNFQIMKINF